MIITLFLLTGCQQNNSSTNPQEEFVKEEEVTVKTFSITAGFSGKIHILSSDKGNILVDADFYDQPLADYIKKNWWIRRNFTSSWALGSHPCP